MIAETRKLATFTLTGMVGYIAMAEKNDTLAAELLAEHRSCARSSPSHSAEEGI